MLGKTLSAAAALALLVAGPVNATCTEANIGGNWAAYLATSEVGFTSWIRCGLAINPAGKIIEGSCGVGSNSVIIPVTGSFHLTVPANCVFTGTIDLTTLGPGGSNLTINHATMSLNKQTVLGVASSGTERQVFKMLKVR